MRSWIGCAVLALALPGQAGQAGKGTGFGEQQPGQTEQQPVRAEPPVDQPAKHPTQADQQPVRAEPFVDERAKPTDQPGPRSASEKQPVSPEPPVADQPGQTSSKAFQPSTRAENHSGKTGKHAVPADKHTGKAAKHTAQADNKQPIVFWRAHRDAAARANPDAPGGANRAPGTKFTFLEEDRGGSAPKFFVEDENGVKWKVKLGSEARAETAATRLIRAAGYFADEDYYRDRIRVQGMKPLSRGKKFVSPDGVVLQARLERAGGPKKQQNWSWHDKHLAGSREFNGLRVMMALINNWDLKAVNNAVETNGDSEQHYVVTDLGASFGRTGISCTRSKGVMKDFVQSPFIHKVSSEHVDFVMHSRPFFLLYALKHNYYTDRTRMELVVRHIPLADARWIGSILAALSPDEIGECFRASGFSPAEVDGYTKALLRRIDELKRL